MQKNIQDVNNFVFGGVQKCVDLVDLVKSFPASTICLQTPASIQSRASPPKFQISFPHRQFNSCLYPILDTDMKSEYKYWADRLPVYSQPVCPVLFEAAARAQFRDEHDRPPHHRRVTFVCILYCNQVHKSDHANHTKST